MLLPESIFETLVEMACAKLGISQMKGMVGTCFLKIFLFEGFKYFNIDGDNKNGRRFYIHEIYNGCKRDPGYLLVACNRANGNPPCSSYESMGDNSGDPRNYICKIIHTASNERSNSGFYSVASAMEIFVK